MHHRHFILPSGISKHVAHGVGFLAGAGENHEILEICGLDEREQQLIALVEPHRVKGVRNGAGHLSAGNGDFHRVSQAPLGKALQNLRHGGGEEEGLAAIPGAEVHNLAHDGQETHVRHAIHFVQHQGLHGLEFHVAAVEMVDEAARGGYDNVHALPELLGLGAVSHAAVEQAHLDIGVLRIGAEGFCQLVCELAGGLQHQHLGLPGVGDIVEQRQGKCGRFTCAGLGGTDNVLPLHDVGNSLLLNRGGVFIAAVLYGFQNGGGKSQFFECHLGFCCRVLC